MRCICQNDLDNVISHLMFAHDDQLSFIQMADFFIEPQQLIFVGAQSQPILYEARDYLIAAALVKRALNNV